MKDQLVSLETAKLAKEKGFDWEVHKMYGNQNTPQLEEYDAGLYMMWGLTLAPTQSLLQKWFRELYDLHIHITVNQFGYGFMYAITDHIKCKNLITLKGGVSSNYTYEQALEAGLIEAFNLI